MDNDQFFKQMASKYAETDGQRLLSELDSLPDMATSRLKRRIWQKLRYSPMKLAGYGSLAAAVIAAILFYRLYSPGTMSGTSSAPSASVTTDYAIIPLSFTLPEGFRIGGVEQDREKTVYYIQNTRLDDVVLTVEKATGRTVTNDLTRITISGHETFGKASKDYCVLEFEKDGYAYNLTSRYAFDTLVEIGKKIL